VTKNDANEQRIGAFWAYSWQVLRQVGRDVKGNLPATGLAVFAAVGVAAFQISYLAAPARPSRESALTAILRSIAVFMAYLLFHFVRAPWQLYRRREGELQERIATIEAEHHDKVCQLEGSLEQERHSRDAERLDYDRKLQQLKELLGRPDLVVDCVLDPDQSGANNGAFLLTLRNAGKPLASNIAAAEIVVPMSEQIIRSGREMREQFAISVAPPDAEPTDWTIYFLPIKDLAANENTPLRYRIDNIGGLQRRSLVWVLSNSPYPGQNWKEDFVGVAPLVIEGFSNGLRWRLKYALCYSVVRKEAWVESREFTKVDG
jgi:hypothetical protein